MVTGKPAVSVIVPARNEAAALGACLESLRVQGAAEIIVVDDGSTDGTGAIAASYEGVSVIAAPPLPQGWCGKANACQAGADVAQGNWLLFTDADTVHLPGSLRRAVAEAERYGASLLSYSPYQELRGFAEQALMPVVFSELACAYRPKDVCDPASEIAAANGQYLLIAREAYDAVDGHAAVARDLLEDVALARAVKRSGRKLRFRFGGDAVRTRMYRSWPQMREGWTKNLALLFPRPGALAARRAVEFAAIAGGLGTALVAASCRRYKVAAAATAIAVPALAHFLCRVQKAHSDWPSTMLSPLGLPLFSYLLWRSRISHKKGRVWWKGREYVSGDDSSCAGTRRRTRAISSGESGLRHDQSDAQIDDNASALTDI